MKVSDGQLEMLLDFAQGNMPSWELSSFREMRRELLALRKVADAADKFLRFGEDSPYEKELDDALRAAGR